MVRQADGTLAETSWTEALSRRRRGLLAAREGGIGVLAGGRLTVEDAYAYGKFARVAAGTNDVDFRARPHSAEELEFLAAHVVGQGPETLDYTRLEAASAVLCVALEPEEEAPIVYLRLRKAVPQARPEGLPPRPVDHARRGAHLPPPAPRPPRPRTTSSRPCRAPRPRCSATCPEHVVEALPGGGRDPRRRARRRGAGPVLGGRRRSAARTGAASAGCRAARASAARSTRVRAPTLLPGGRPVADAAARAEVEAAWGLAAGTLPATPGRDTDEILAAAAIGELAGAGGRRASTRTTWPIRPPRSPACARSGSW